MRTISSSWTTRWSTSAPTGSTERRSTSAAQALRANVNALGGVNTFNIESTGVGGPYNLTGDAESIRFHSQAALHSLAPLPEAG